MVFSTEYKSLMNKFHLSVDQLDYKYIQNCQSVKQLERILRVLRSGEEGLFPHLLKFCEDKLRDVDPCNRLLQVAEKIKRYSELPESDRKEILADMEDWSHEMSKYKPQSASKESDIAKELPPIRKQKNSMNHNENKTNEISEESGVQSKGCKPRSHKEWDKYDVDKELKKLDSEDKEQVGTVNIDRKDVPELSKSVSLTNLSQTECENVANLERMKGNEAYKAQDYEEAAIYYTRSLSAFKTVKSLNNRAQTYIKLKRYFEAVLDCNEAISMEPSNVKALYRRGTAHKEAKMYDLAVVDFSILLEMEPDNNSAKEQLREIEKLQCQEADKNKKVLIEELETDSQTQEISIEKQLQNEEKNISKRITIEEVTDTTPRPTLDEICHCTDNTDQAFSKNTQEMFSIVQNQKSSKSKPLSKLNTTYKDKNNSDEVLISFASETFQNDRKLELRDTTKDQNKGVTEKLVESSSRPCNKNNLTQKRMDQSNPKLIPTNEKEQEYSNDNCKVKESNLFGWKDTKENEIKTKECVNNIGIIPMQTKITPFKFIQVWLSNNANYNPSNGADCLLTMKPDELPQLLSNKLDGPLLNGILMAIDSINKMGRIEEGMEYLNNLMKVPRINIISLFLSKEEKQNVKTMLIFMEKKLNLSLSQVREVLTII